ncbi:hypothetical protein CsSME_00043520 [Camellia sinensis var. sinensis]
MQLQKVFSKKAYIDWNATYDYYEKMNVKEAYYLSTEYLQSRALLNAMQGRALLNAIGNLEFSKAYAEALRKLVLNLEYIARQQASHSSIVTAELWGIWHGLQLAWSEGHHRVIVESDSVEAISALAKANPLHPQFNLLQEIWELMARSWECDLQRIWREANVCADLLAKGALSMAVNREDLVDAPSVLPTALDRDIWGLGSSRSVFL